MLKKRSSAYKFIPCDDFSQTYNWQKTNGIGSKMPKKKKMKKVLKRKRK